MSILVGDCLEKMREFPDNHFSAIVTDPPYGLSKDGKRGFMGKEWDGVVPGVEYWQAALRVTKPGGHILAFGGSRTYHRLACAIEDAGWEVRDCCMFLYGAGFPKSYNFGRKLGGDWEGYGTALKPSYEPILLGMKPLDGTFLQNAQKWGVAGLNIDASRIETSENLGRLQSHKANKIYGLKDIGFIDNSTGKGRWPANLLLDSEAAQMLDEQSGVLKSGGGDKGNKTQDGGYGKGYGYVHRPSKPDSGGASRFFYTAKASSKERGEGNIHPTVKPLAIMTYLLKLVAPPKDALILDPFAGSGTTILAAKQLGISAIGIEKSEEYAEIARTRVDSYKAPTEQLSFFGDD